MKEWDIQQLFRRAHVSSGNGIVERCVQCAQCNSYRCRKWVVLSVRFLATTQTLTRRETHSEVLTHYSIVITSPWAIIFDAVEFSISWKCWKHRPENYYRKKKWLPEGKFLAKFSAFLLITSKETSVLATNSMDFALLRPLLMTSQYTQNRYLTDSV